MVKRYIVEDAHMVAVDYDDNFYRTFPVVLFRCDDI